MADKVPKPGTTSSSTRDLAPPVQLKTSESSVREQSEEKVQNPMIKQESVVSGLHKQSGVQKKADVEEETGKLEAEQ